ncbi:MAG: hypothetical protein IJP97_07250 [Synergistaceae bacterium]|nr:hypothetical protein [Synergistaceae bacterium]
MSDLALNVRWQEILRESEAGNIPHTRAIVSPSKWHDEIIESLANIILGSYRPSHPDLLIAGSTDKAPDIDTCRNLIQDIALRPLESDKRLAVIMNAGRLNQNAGNSLLKLSEEPPSHAYILFLMDDAKFFLGTLKSRSRFSVLISDESFDSAKPPETESEWLEWLSGKRDNASIASDLDSWTNYAVREKDFMLADKIYRLKLINDRKNLSAAIMSDMIILTLKDKEGSNEIEDIFNDIW